TTLSAGLSKITITAGSGSGDTVVPTPDDGSGDLTPPAPTAVIAELMAGAPGKTGSDTAPLVLVEWSDYQCPYCKAFFINTEKALVEKYVKTGKLQILYKDFPLSFHPMAAPSANAARCAGDQGKYWEMHDKIFEETYKINPSATSQYTNDDLKQWGKDLGLNTTTFDKCVDDDAHATDITANFNEGAANGISGTPSFFLGPRDGEGQLIVGAQPLATFEAAIDALLAQQN
ncbi:MAG: thioredoxin domain-containing protein, partial [archaeon]